MQSTKTRQGRKPRNDLWVRWFREGGPRLISLGRFIVDYGEPIQKKLRGMSSVQLPDGIGAWISSEKFPDRRTGPGNVNAWSADFGKFTSHSELLDWCHRERKALAFPKEAIDIWKSGKLEDRKELAPLLIAGQFWSQGSLRACLALDVAQERHEVTLGLENVWHHADEIESTGALWSPCWRILVVERLSAIT